MEGRSVNIFVVAINGQPDAAFAKESDAIAYSRQQRAEQCAAIIRRVPFYGYDECGEGSELLGRGLPTGPKFR